MKRLYILLLISLFIFISCSDKNSELSENKNISMKDLSGESYLVSGDTVVTLTDMDEESMYAIYFDQKSSRIVESSRDTDPKILATNSGTYIPIADNGSVRFSPQEIGLSSGKMKIVELRCDSNSMELDELKDPYLLFHGGKLFEEFYRVDLKKAKEEGLDLSNVVLLNAKYGSGSGNSDYGIFGHGFNWLSNNIKSHGVINLERSKAINLYNSMIINKRDINKDYPWKHKLKLVNPIEVEISKKEIKSNEQVFKVSKDKFDSSLEYVLEIIPPSNFPANQYSLINDNANTRDIQGYNNPSYLVPVTGYGDSKLILYIGKIKEDFIFDCLVGSDDANLGEIIIREAKENERPTNINLDNTEKIEVEFNGDFARKAYTFEGSSLDNLTGLEISVSFYDEEGKELSDFNGARLAAMSVHRNKEGYSRRGIGKQSDIAEIRQGRDFLSYLWVDRGNLPSGVRAEITIKKK